MAAGVEVGRPVESMRSRTGQTSRRVQLVVAYLALGIGSLWALAPFLWMISTSLKTDSQVLVYPPAWIPNPVAWGNYEQVTRLVPFWRFLVNTAIVAVTVTILELVTSSFAAYAFARLRFPGRDKLFLLYLATLMIPGQVTLIPNFLVISWLGWVDTYAALIIPAAFSAFGTFLLRQFFLTIPLELEEAAVIDGASRLRILLQVIVPIARPAIAVLAVFTFINYWNSYLWPLIIINSLEKATVPLGLGYFLSQNGNEWHLLMAACAISMLPTVVIVVLLQRHLVRGIAISGMGGR